MATGIHTRAERRLRLTVYEASLHATGHEAQQLLLLGDAHRRGEIATRDALAAVVALRVDQQARRWAA